MVDVAARHHDEALHTRPGGSGRHGARHVDELGLDDARRPVVLRRRRRPGKVDDRKLREAAEQWGTLPPDRRDALVQELTRDLPARYKPMIDEYFRSLNRLHGYSGRQ